MAWYHTRQVTYYFRLLTFSLAKVHVISFHRFSSRFWIGIMSTGTTGQCSMPWICFAQDGIALLPKRTWTTTIRRTLAPFKRNQLS